jgi:hypothetical protein
MDLYTYMGVPRGRSDGEGGAGGPNAARIAWINRRENQALQPASA